MIALLAALALAQVEGRVLERGTGDPIPGARVAFVGGPAVRTDAGGRFAVDLDGTWTVRVEADGYGVLGAVLTAPAEVTFHLDPRPGYVVVVQAFQETPHVSRHQVDAEMAEETPGTYEDAVRLVQSLPGVAVQREFSPTAGALEVRGASGHRYLLDGVDLPYLYHYNQYASVFPTRWLDTLELLPSSFGAAHGDTVGAVVDASSRVERPAVVHGGVQANLVMAGADVEVPVGERWWAAASGRRSYLDLAGERSEQYTLWPVFHDFALRAGHAGPATDTWMFLWGAGDRWTRAAGELDLLDPVEQERTPSFEHERGFLVGGVAHRWDTGRIVGAVVRHRLRGDLSGLGGQDLRTTTFTSRLDDRIRLGSRASLIYGYETRAEVMDLEVRSAGDLGLLVAEEAPALARGVDVDARLHRTRSAAWAQILLRLGDVGVLPGLRVDTDSHGETLLLEPRLAARWRAGDQTAVEASAGLYHQSPDTELLVGGDLPTTRSWQVSAALEQTFADRLELGVDVYAKHLRDAVVPRVDGPPEIAPAGSAYGVEVLSRYRLREHFFVHAWVALSRSLVRTAEGRRPADADQPFVAGLVASWDVDDRYNLGVRYRIGSGRPWTPVEEGLYDATLDRYLPVAAPENSARMPLYQKLDLHAARTWTFDGWTLTASAELWLVPPSSAQLYPTFSYDFSEQGWVTGPTILPLVGLRARF